MVHGVDDIVSLMMLVLALFTLGIPMMMEEKWIESPRPRSKSQK